MERTLGLDACCWSWTPSLQNEPL